MKKFIPCNYCGGKLNTVKSPKDNPTKIQVRCQKCRGISPLYYFISLFTKGRDDITTAELNVKLNLNVPYSIDINNYKITNTESTHQIVPDSSTTVNAYINENFLSPIDSIFEAIPIAQIKPLAALIRDAVIKQLEPKLEAIQKLLIETNQLLESKNDST